MPSQLVGTSCSSTPKSSASFLATSISKPMYSPFLSCIAQGTNVENPTRSAPLSITASIVDSARAAFAMKNGRTSMTVRACKVKSAAAIALTSDVSFIREISCPARLGKTLRKTWGKMTYRSVFGSDMPRLKAASHWAWGRARMPPRSISAKYTPSNKARQKTAVMNGLSRSTPAMTK